MPIERYPHTEFPEVAADGLIKVVKYYNDGETSEAIIRREDLEKITQAWIELHYDPGINPHNGSRTPQIHAISYMSLHEAGPYWHTTPGLHGVHSPEGAQTYAFSDEHLVWQAEED